MMRDQHPLLSINDYIRSYQQLRSQKGAAAGRGAKSLRIALLGSSTLKGLEEVLYVKCRRSGIAPRVYSAGYNQYSQEVLNPGSGLYKFKPDIVFIFIDFQALAGDWLLTPYAETESSRRKWARSVAGQLITLTSKVKSRSDAMIVLHNFEIPARSPLGLLENRQTYGPGAAVAEINERLRLLYRNDPKIYVFDYESFCAKAGKDALCDPKFYYLADMRVSPDHIPALADEYMAYVKAYAGLSRKCIVLDLDDTLWGGVVGEDGIGGIRLGPDPQGRSFWEFQKTLLALHQRGILLAVNSRNNAADALEVFRRHPHSVLREKHFAALRINWADKAQNMREIARELNIGTDSLLFLDDDAANREWVRRSLPEVLVPEWPEDPALFTRALLDIKDLNTLTLTQEDLRRGQMYVEQRRRSEWLQAAGDMDSFLKGLEIEMQVKRAGPSILPRLAQLTQRTNQFNLTTRRYQPEELSRAAKSPGNLVAGFLVKDKFGDNGLVGTAVVRRDGNTAEIDSFLMSCRVIGRGIEQAMLAHILNWARKTGIVSVRGRYIPTAKNVLVRDFYKQNRFSPAHGKGPGTFWQCKISKPCRYPAHIRVVG